MWIQKFLAILLGKTIFQLTRILKIGGGSAAPGYYALKLYPNLVSDLIKTIPQNIVITGTNGKTTTARMLAHFAKSQGLKILRNHTGSNLERGIASTLISSSKIVTGQIKDIDLAIWELDEAAFNKVAPKLNPQIIVFLNVFRDQLDRYGEIDTIVKKWCQTLKDIPSSAKLFINADDYNLHQLKECFSGEVQTFGLNEDKIEGEKVVKTKKLPADIKAKDIKTEGLSGSGFTLQNGKKDTKVNLSIPGNYHIYDFLAAFSVASELGLSDQEIINSLENFSPAFGRVEKLSLQPSRLLPKKSTKEGYIFLIKNPTGATQVLQTIKGEIRDEDRLLLALNDNFADGTDVSWIWDANFEQVQNSSRAKSYIRQAQYDPERQPNGSRDYLIYCSGSRAEDLAVRLKYAGFDPKTILIDNNLEQAFKRAGEGLKGKLIILPTYTALLELQTIMVKQNIKTHYWKEES